MNRKEPLQFYVKVIGEYVLNKSVTHSMIPWIVANKVRDACIASKDIILELSDSTLTGKLINDESVLFCYTLQNITSYLERSSKDENVYSFTVWDAVDSKTTLHIHRTIDEQSCRKIIKYTTIKKDGFDDSRQLASKEYEVSYVVAVKVPMKSLSSITIDEILNKNSEVCQNSNHAAITDGSPLRNERSQSLCSYASSAEYSEIDEGTLIDSEETTWNGKDGSSKLMAHRFNLDSANSSSTESIESVTVHELHSAKINSVPEKSSENRTLIFLIRSSELLFISPDSKDILLKKSLNSVVECISGEQNGDHFGLVCSDRTNNSNDGYICYVFKCKNSKIVKEVMNVLEKTFKYAQERCVSSSPLDFCCKGSPMLWFHGFCDVVNKCETPETIRETIDFIIKHDLKKDEQQAAVRALQLTNNEDVKSENEALMYSLFELSQEKQLIHENRVHKIKTEFSDILSNLKKYKSFTSLENIFLHQSSTVARKKEVRFRSSTLDNVSAVVDKTDSPVNSGDRRRSSTVTGAQTKGSLDMHSYNQLANIEPKGTFFKIFKLACRCTKFKAVPEECNDCHISFRSTMSSVSKSLSEVNIVCEKRKITSKELRNMWKKAITIHISIIRMTKRNKKLIKQTISNVSEEVKLNYDDPFECDEECVTQWQRILMDCNCDWNLIHETVNKGVPKEKRGEIWLLMSRNEQNIQTSYHGYNIQTPISELLKQLTDQQHEIIIDLNRTFPNQPYFAEPFGEGQLSLFNVLKAYSLIDTQVGYCQGIAFIAGILLLHTNEENAFKLLKHILITNGLREQYTPEMSSMPRQLFMLSRLLWETNRDLYDHFEKHDISSSLYATPWFLTLFASQFSIGFVARFFDVLLLVGAEAVYRLSLAILEHFKERLLNCESFEAISLLLKSELPSINTEEAALIFDRVFTLDISVKLSLIESVFKILNEETDYFTSERNIQKMNAHNDQSSNVTQLIQRCKNLEMDNMSLQKELEQCTLRHQLTLKDWDAMFQALTATIANNNLESET